MFAPSGLGSVGDHSTEGATCVVVSPARNGRLSLCVAQRRAALMART